MTHFITSHTLDLLTGLALLVVAFAAARWSTMPVLQRIVALFFTGIAQTS